MNRPANHKLMAACSLALLLLCMPPPATSAPIDNDPLIHSSYAHELMQRGEFDKGLEQLRTAYLLFPLNETLKRNLAEGYAVVGHSFFKKLQYDKADEQYVKAMELYPEETNYALLRGICNYHLQKFDVARHTLEIARQKAPDSVETIYYLGLVLYETEQQQAAVALWEEGLKHSPDRAELKAILNKVRKEMAVEADMDRGHSSRFSITFDPGITTTNALAILEVLEEAANVIDAELGHFPDKRIPVVVYQSKDFKFVTDAPDWSGGMYDGTIRLPLGSMKEITPRIREVLFHEYAHVVVYGMTNGNCPTWLNEGIADFFGRLNHNKPLHEFGKALRSKYLLPFSSLARGFASLSPQQATLAYQQSYAFVNYLVTTYGWHRISSLLNSLGKGQLISSALAAAFNDDGVTLEQLTSAWLQNTEQSLTTK